MSGPFPIPRDKMICPVCSDSEVFIKQCVFFKRKDNDYRCDVSFKCTCCSHVWTHGVLVTKEKAEPMRQPGKWLWRDMKEYLRK